MRIKWNAVLGWLAAGESGGEAKLMFKRIATIALVAVLAVGFLTSCGATTATTSTPTTPTTPSTNGSLTTLVGDLPGVCDAVSFPFNVTDLSLTGPNGAGTTPLNERPLTPP